MSGYYLTIAETGAVEIKEMPDSMQKALTEWQTVCGGYIEEAEPYGVTGTYKILVREDALVAKEPVAVNFIASNLYGIGKHGHALYGNAVIAKTYWDKNVKCLKFEGFNIKQVKYLLDYIIPWQGVLNDGGADPLGVWED